MEDEKHSGSTLDHFRAGIAQYAHSSGAKVAKRATPRAVAQSSKLPLKRSRSDGNSVDGRSKKRKRVEPNKDPNAYSHLKCLTDYLAPNLDILFCGIKCRIYFFMLAAAGMASIVQAADLQKPAITSRIIATIFGSACMSLTPTRIPPDEDYTLPERFNYGMTNLAKRPSRVASELSRTELEEGVIPLFDKVAEYKPKIVCVVGIGIWETIERHLRSTGAISEKKSAIQPEPGLKPYKMVHSISNGTSLATLSPIWKPAELVSESKGDDIVDETLFFNVPSTSARVTTFQYPDKVACFARLKELLRQVKSSEFSTSEMVVITRPV